MDTLNGKTVIVTGASRGIGAAVARTLAAAGASVVVNYAGSQQAADAVVADIKKQGGNAIAVQADVSKTDEVKRLFEITLAEFGRIDVLVNNAGIMITKPIKDTTDEDYNRQMDVNVKGVFNTLREAATHLADNGSIINFSTSVNRLMLPTYGTYVASKAAVEQLTRVFSKEVGSRGIRVNSISPGPTNTDLFISGKSDEAISRLAGMAAFNRLGEPEDIAQLVLFLASDASAWITAQNIGVNGGMA